MTRVELLEATGSLSEYTRKASTGDIVVTRRGRPVALLRVLSDQEWEDYAVSASPVFRRILKESGESYRKHGGISLERVEQELGLPPRPARKARSASRKK